MRCNDQVLEMLQKLRVEIRHEAFKVNNFNLDEQFYALHKKSVGVDIRPPEPEHPRGHNPFRKHMTEQKNCIKSSLEVLQQTVKEAKRTN